MATFMWLRLLAGAPEELGRASWRIPVLCEVVCLCIMAEYSRLLEHPQLIGAGPRGLRTCGEVPPSFAEQHSSGLKSYEFICTAFAHKLRRQGAPVVVRTDPQPQGASAETWPWLVALKHMRPLPRCQQDLDRKSGETGSPGRRVGEASPCEARQQRPCPAGVSMSEGWLRDAKLRC